ncbi:MAG: response regulator [Candidatus Marinimicrobia bacterium]|nr:response regulator [Candidatus Neomarinimicrobiota bacterium]
MKRRILIVDDSKTVLALLENFLVKQGYEVVIANNGKEAFDLIRKRPIPVVFTDIKMPEMNGIELIEKIKETYPMIRVIMGTGYVDFKYGLSAFTNGAEDILFKPYDLAKLKAIVERSFDFLDQWEMRLKELQELKKDTEGVLGGQETILYVDDDEKVKSFAKFALEKVGYNFINAANGLEALGNIESAKDIHLIITSVKLSDMNGKDIVKTFLNANPAIKVLYIVSYKEEQIFEDDVLHESDDYIYFPFTQKLLYKAVREVLDR